MTDEITTDSSSYEDEKMDFEYQNVIRRNSDILVEKAMIQKKDELDKYKNVIRLYGHPESLKPEFEEPDLLSTFENESRNKILEARHDMNMENRILNIFIMLFTILITFQFTLIIILKLDIDWPSFNLIDYVLIFHFAYLAVLFVGKALTYVFLLAFFARIYIGLKVFSSSVNTNILLKLVNMQFNGFLNSSVVTLGIIVLDVIFKCLLRGLELIPGQSDETDSDIQISLYNFILNKIQMVFSLLDIVLYSTILIGLILVGLRKIVKYWTDNQSVRLP